MQEWFTAAEIAELPSRHKLKGLPATSQGVNALAVREGWHLAASNVRKRAGRGGGVEFHFSLLPDAFLSALQADHSRALELFARSQRPAQQAATIAVTAMNARQRSVMEARAAVLGAIDAYQIMHGASQRQAMLNFISEPRDFDVGETVIVRANDRANDERAISLRTLQNWMRLRDTGGIEALAPRATRDSKPISDAFMAFLKYYALPSKPCATEALERYRENLTDRRLDLTLDEVRYTLRTKLNNIEKHVGREGLHTLKARLA